MAFDSYIGHKISQGIVAVQRPAILVLMTIAAIAFVFLGFYAIVKFGYPMLNGEIETKPDANRWHLIGFVLLVCVPPFLVAWLSAHYAKKALRQIREDGVLYSDPTE